MKQRNFNNRLNSIQASGIQSVNETKSNNAPTVKTSLNENWLHFDHKGIHRVHENTTLWFVEHYSKNLKCYLTN